MSRKKKGLLAASWNTHALLTMAALKHFEAKLSRRVPVQRLETFLSLCRDDLTESAQGFRASLTSRERQGSLTVRPIEMLTETDFVAAFQLNPATRFHYVKSADLQHAQGFGHDESRQGPPGGLYAPVSDMDEMSALEILVTYSDEPDWGMDQELFRKGFVFGRRPFGPGSGKSSQAPFHMAFFHESMILKTIFPNLKRSLMPYRIKLFSDLSGIAFKAGADYWGFRFAAWAVHYLQDLTQPYHAKALPVPISPMIFRAAVVPRLQLFKANKNYLSNRHMIFESAVHFILNRSVKSGTDHPFIHAPAGKGEAYSGELDAVMYEAAQLPAQTARTIDGLTMKIIGDPRLKSPKFDLSGLRRYGIEDVWPEGERRNPETLNRFIDLVSKCLYQTGKVTRYGLKDLL